jgi:hypothetical protein
LRQTFPLAAKPVGQAPGGSPATHRVTSTGIGAGSPGSASCGMSTKSPESGRSLHFPARAAAIERRASSARIAPVIVREKFGLVATIGR